MPVGAVEAAFDIHFQQATTMETLIDREAFRIIRNFAQLVNDPEGDFKIVAEHLAKRLPATLQTACNIRRRFCNAEILEPTAPYVPQKLAARFRWIAHLKD